MWLVVKALLLIAHRLGRGLDAVLAKDIRSHGDAVCAASSAVAW